MKKTISNSRYLLLFVAAFFMAIGEVRALSPVSCDTKIGGIRDINCDGKIKIAFVGDSYVAGVGDSISSSLSGYAYRCQRSFRNRRIQVIKVGIPGYTVEKLYQDVMEINARGILARSNFRGLIGSDYVIFDIGRNDFWSEPRHGVIYSKLQRAKAALRSAMVKEYCKTGTISDPLIVGDNPVCLKPVTSITPEGRIVLMGESYLAPPNRTDQGNWVRQFNRIVAGMYERKLLRGASVDNLPPFPFINLSKRLLNDDQLHPSASGYSQLATMCYSHMGYIERYLSRVR